MSKKKQGKKPAADDDDWEALLDKQIAENKAVVSIQTSGTQIDINMAHLFDLHGLLTFTVLIV